MPKSDAAATTGRCSGSSKRKMSSNSTINDLNENDGECVVLSERTISKCKDIKPKYTNISKKRPHTGTVSSEKLNDGDGKSNSCKDSKSQTKKKRSSSRENGENIEYAIKWGGESDFSGNEDDEGSVVSAVLDEDICYQCGQSTLSKGASSKDGWDGIIMCDVCDGEYHLHCQNLKVLPKGDFVCSKCKREDSHFSSISFDVDNSSFKNGLKALQGGADRTVVYSPAKPLQLAWEECLKKGLMVVADAMPYHIMMKLTHGTVEKRTASGRVADIWRGATVEAARRLSSTSCHDIIDRDGRYDMKLPNFVVQELQLEMVLEPILSRLRTIMGGPKPQLRTHNVVFVPVGSLAQQWHVDDSKVKHKMYRYFTILIHLNPLDCNSGGTEIWMDDIKTGDLLRGRPGDALVFPGNLLHRGHANNGSGHRFFYYASFACGADANAGAV